MLLDDWVKVDYVPDMLGNRVYPGAVIAYPVDRTTRVSRVVECHKLTRGSNTFHRVRIIGVSSNYRGDPESWTTYKAWIDNMTQVVQIHPDMFNDRLRWLRDRANEEGLP